MAQRAYRDSGVNHGTLLHHGRGVYARGHGAYRMVLAPQLRQPCKEKVGVVDHQVSAATLAGLGLHLWADCDAARPGREHLRLQLGVAEKTEVLGPASSSEAIA